jgi:hypothetical protein
LMKFSLLCKQSSKHWSRHWLNLVRVSCPSHVNPNRNVH